MTAGTEPHLTTHEFPDFTLLVFGGCNGIHELNDNVDVEIRLPNGDRYCPTFFTLANIASLFAKNKATGECLNGTYLWAVDMILVEHLTLEVIEETVRDLIREGELSSACRLLEPLEDDLGEA